MLKLPIIKKHTGLIHLRVYSEQDIQKLTPIGRVYDDGMLYIDRGENLIAVLFTDVSLGVGEDLIPKSTWSYAAFPAAYGKALSLFENMRDGFYDYQIKQGLPVPDAMYHDVENNVMLPIHLFLPDEYENKEVGDTYLFYNTRTTVVCLGSYDPGSAEFRLNNGDSVSDYGLLFGVYRMMGVVLVEDEGV
jgi:hypothetical protein